MWLTEIDLFEISDSIAKSFGRIEQDVVAKQTELCLLHSGRCRIHENQSKTEPHEQVMESREMQQKDIFELFLISNSAGR